MYQTLRRLADRRVSKHTEFNSVIYFELQLVLHLLDCSVFIWKSISSLSQFLYTESNTKLMQHDSCCIISTHIIQIHLIAGTDNVFGWITTNAGSLRSQWDRV